MIFREIGKSNPAAQICSGGGVLGKLIGEGVTKYQKQMCNVGNPKFDLHFGDGL